MKIITPVLHRSTYSGLSSIEEEIGICLDTVKNFWYVPKNATRFWFELVEEPEENSVAIGLRRWEACVVWKEKHGHSFSNFHRSKGLHELLKDVLLLGKCTLVNVVLWYE